MAGYRIRREQLQPGLVVIRGDLLDRDLLRVDAERARRRFGQYGISVMAARDAGAIDDLARTVFRRFEWLTITTVADIQRTGLEILPTFRRPHCTVLLPDLEADLDRLLRCQTVLAINPHAEAEIEEL